jgi:hypothetical protein
VTGASSTLALLEELIEADGACAVTLAELERLLETVAANRSRAEELLHTLASAPGERDRLAAALAEAEADVSARSDALAEAQAELEAASRKGDSERLAAAQRFVVRARDAVAIAEKRAVAARAALGEHEATVAAAEREAPEVEARAAEVATSLRGRPRLAADAARIPAPGLEGVLAWASAARAALTVARSGVASEREAVIRQANELGSAALGEPIGAASATVVRERVATALGR